MIKRKVLMLIKIKKMEAKNRIRITKTRKKRMEKQIMLTEKKEVRSPKRTKSKKKRIQKRIKNKSQRQKKPTKPRPRKPKRKKRNRLLSHHGWQLLRSPRRIVMPLPVTTFRMLPEPISNRTERWEKREAGPRVSISQTHSLSSGRTPVEPWAAA